MLLIRFCYNQTHCAKFSAASSAWRAIQAGSSDHHDLFLAYLQVIKGFRFKVFNSFQKKNPKSLCKNCEKQTALGLKVLGNHGSSSLEDASVCPAKCRWKFSQEGNKHSQHGSQKIRRGVCSKQQSHQFQWVPDFFRSRQPGFGHKSACLAQTTPLFQGPWNEGYQQLPGFCQQPPWSPPPQCPLFDLHVGSRLPSNACFPSVFIFIAKVRCIRKALYGDALFNFHLPLNRIDQNKHQKWKELVWQNTKRMHFDLILPTTNMWMMYRYTCGHRERRVYITLATCILLENYSGNRTWIQLNKALPQPLDSRAAIDKNIFNHAGKAERVEMKWKKC